MWAAQQANRLTSFFFLCFYLFDVKSHSIFWLFSFVRRQLTKNSHTKTFIQFVTYWLWIREGNDDEHLICCEASSSKAFLTKRKSLLLFWLVLRSTLSVWLFTIKQHLHNRIHWMVWIQQMFLLFIQFSPNETLLIFLDRFL